MAVTDKKPWLFERTSGIEQTIDPRMQRHLPAGAAFGWLGRGWRDLWTSPGSSLLYGLVVFAISVAVVYTMFTVGWDFVVFPALAGFMIVGPVVAVGLYQKSRAIERGDRVRLDDMLLVRGTSSGQIIFLGLLLSLLMLLWMRAAVLLYALFFGYRPFPGTDHIVQQLIGSPIGWAMLVTGTLVGGLFAVFAFAISAFSVPMLLARRLDAVTAMGLSFKFVWNNAGVMFVWGAIVAVLFAVSVATALVGLIIVFPLLGHATWHAYRAIVEPEGQVSPDGR
jgi:uncharacterized membrane protein